MFDPKYNLTVTPRGILTGDNVPTPERSGMRSRQDIYNDIVSSGYYPSQNEIESAIGYYWVDESIGAMYKFIKNKLNMLNDTIIILVNDHGAQKRKLYEFGTRIFQFVRYPYLNQLLNNNTSGSGTNTNVINHLLVSNVDITATVIDLADHLDHGLLDTVKNDGYVLDGHSWKSHLSCKLYILLIFVFCFWFSSFLYFFFATT